MVRVIVYENRFRDDLLFCFLLAREALGKPPKIRNDLFDVESSYILNGGMFWLAVDENERVVGMLGVSVESTTDIWLKRFYVKPNLKRKGVGGMLLNAALEYAKNAGIKVVHTRFCDEYTEAFAFYSDKGFIKAAKSDGLNHYVKTLIF